MPTKPIPVASCLIAAALCCLARGADRKHELKQKLQQPRQICSPKLAVQPAIDGKLDEPCWERAGRTGPFFLVGRAILATDQTEGLAFRDGENLYLGVVCRDPDTLNLRAVSARSDDSAVFRDDCVELFLDPGRQLAYCHLAVNSRGALYDSRTGDASWDSGAAVGTHVVKGAWSLEIRLPFAALGPAGEGAEWGLNICRSAPHYENPRDRDLSTWACLTGESFHEPEAFGRLLLREPDESYRRSVKAYNDAAAEHSRLAADAKLKADVHTFDREGLDPEALKQRLQKYGWYAARGSWRKDTRIFPIATRYNILLMKTAFAEHRLHELERMCFLRWGAPAGGPLDQAALNGLWGRFERVEHALNEAYQRYGAVFRVFRDSGVAPDSSEFDAACDTLRTSTAEFAKALADAEQAVRTAAAKGRQWEMPPKLGRQSRSVPAFQPSGKMNRLVIAGYGIDPFPRYEGDGGPEGNEFEYTSTRGVIKPAVHTETEIDFRYDRSWIGSAREEGYGYYGQLPFGDHYWTYCPYWFLEKHKSDPDILFRSWDGLLPKQLGRFTWREQDGGLVVAHGGAPNRGETVQLNHVHPKVREYIRDYLPKAVAFCRQFPDVGFYVIGGETNNYMMTDKGLRLRGYGPSATRAFRAYLRKKYADIAALNRAWQSSYAGFDRIVQPRDQHAFTDAERQAWEEAGKLLTPLMAEFRAFLADTHIDYLKLVYETIKRTDPDRPVSSYFGCPFWRYSGYRDRIMEVCDLLEFHGSSTKMSFSNVYAASLLRRHPEKGLSYLETHWAFQEEKSRVAEERVQRRTLAKETCRSTVWGRTLQRRWLPYCSSFDQFYYFLHPRYDWTILRYSAPAQIIAKREMENLDWILTHSAIPPSRILVVDPSASLRNHGSHAQMMDRTHAFLFPRNYLYEILPEEYLLNGKARLDEYGAVIVPYAPYFPHSLALKLIDWVKAGGALVTIGCTGLNNELGLPDGTLLRELLGTSREEQVAASRKRHTETSVRDSAVGKGQVLHVPHILHLLHEPSVERILALLERTAGRNAWSENDRLEVLLRIDEQGALYVSVLNPNPDETLVDTVIVPRNLPFAVDVTLPGGCPVKIEKCEVRGAAATRFRLRLRPCELAFLYCGRELR